jgi:hypothetical protein
MRKRYKILIGLFVAFIVLTIAGLVFLNAKTYKPTTEALTFLKGSEEITVESTSSYYHFHNNTENYTSENAVIFYPGGLVEAAAYSRFCFTVAGEGTDCFIAIMPLNLAIFNVNAASQIISKYPEINSWQIGGHSLGGVMACRYVNSAVDEKVVGLYLFASYCDQKILNDNLDVVSLVGSNDQVLNKQAYIEAKPNLPESARFVDIEGGNHSQFGDYGLQAGDGIATITTEEQIRVTVGEIVNSL